MRFAVIDTETNYNDEVMSIGVVIAEGDTKKEIASRYYIVSPEYEVGGTYSNALYDVPDDKTMTMSREKVIKDIKALFKKKSIDYIFAYDAFTDYKNLPELADYKWVDIMKIAAYRQYNKFIPKQTECLRTGRLKKGYTVEGVLNMMIENYKETHNSYFDASDERRIVELLNLDMALYESAVIN
ncbi:MAG: hypothetical protein IJJ89_04445 [Eubacterium sp.]|nr:hypothetical protein [Eubacterium sp.]